VMLREQSRNQRQQSLALIVIAAASLAPGLWVQEPAQARPFSSAPQNQSEAHNSGPTLPRGKKLMLKDGSLHLVREYEVQGDRVRYYSLERSQWEEIPADLVDWDATRRVEAEEAKRDGALVTKLHKEEEAHRILPLDIDASLEAAPGVFLPPGEGVFVFDGKAVLKISPASTDTNLSKRRLTEQILIPIKVVPSLTKISVKGAHAGVRLTTGQPEFYMRTADEHEPKMDLIRAKVHGNGREIEDIDKLAKETQVTRRSLPMQRWQIARGVYRFTLGETLDPGEYAMVEIVEAQGQTEGQTLYVWDFGVDAAGSKAASGHKE
jgi:hypothetical protein